MILLRRDSADNSMSPDPKMIRILWREIFLSIFQYIHNPGSSRSLQRLRLFSIWNRICAAGVDAVVDRFKTVTNTKSMTAEEFSDGAVLALLKKGERDGKDPWADECKHLAAVGRTLPVFTGQGDKVAARHFAPISISGSG